MAEAVNESNLGRLPHSPIPGKFTNRQGQDYVPGTPGSETNPNPGGSWTPDYTEGLYSSPAGSVHDVGYEVLVLAGPDYTDAIALISSHQGLMITRELSADGGGTITLNRDAPLFHNTPAEPDNLLPNPDFTTQKGGTYVWGWQVNSRSTPTTYGTATSWLSPTGTANNSLYVLTPGTGDPKINTLEGTSGIPVTPGVNMTFTAQAKPTTVGRPTVLFVDFYDADGVYIHIGKSLRMAAIKTEPNVINYLRLDGEVPDGARYASVGVEVSATGVAAEQHRFDNFAFYATPEATPFYDGRDKSDIIDKENLWEIYYNGMRIHEFIGTVRSQDLVNPSETRTVSVSGAGTTELLKRVRILPSAWSIRDGKPWIVKPFKTMREDFSTDYINTKLWNKKVTMNVGQDFSDPTIPKLQLMNSTQSPAQEMIGSGPWDLRYGVSLPGDQSGFANALYFAAYPYLLPTPVPTEEGDFFPADFLSYFELFLDEENRATILIRSKLTSTGVKTNQISAQLTTDGNTVDGMPGAINYNETTMRWLRFRMSAMYVISFEYSADGITWTGLASKTLTSSNTAQWYRKLDQVNFRVYSQFSGVPFAYYPVSGRPTTGAGQQGYTPNTGTQLLPVSNDPDLPNPAYVSIARINDNGVPDTKSPIYDQMGYFKWKIENAHSSRGVLSNIIADWTAGNYREGSVVPGIDSIGNKRKGNTKTYFKLADGTQVNVMNIKPYTGTPAADITPVPTGATRDGSYKNTSGVLVYPKYTYKDPTTNAESEAFLVKVQVTEPTEGQSFYDYFVQCCNLAKVDWSMKPGRNLEIYDTDPDLTGGVVNHNAEYFNRNDAVFFHEGYSTISKQLAKSSESIVNYVIGHDTAGNYLLAKDDASIAKWGVREAWVEVDYTDPTSVSLDTAISTVLAIGTNEVESWTIAVPVMEGIRPFIDYKEGDWISVAKHTGADPKSTESQFDIFRVMAISLSVDINAVESVELTLTSLVESRTKLLQEKLNNVSPTSQAAVTSVPPTSSYVQATSTSLGTLGNVSVEGAVTGSYLRFNSSGIWVAQPPDPVPSSQPTSYRSDFLGNGSATGFTIKHNLNSTAVKVAVIRSDGYDITGMYVTIPPTTEGGSPTMRRTAIPVIVDANRIKVVFDSDFPPAASSFRVVVIRGSLSTSGL